MGWPDAESLLAGPRGRQVCWSLLDPGDCPEWSRVWHGAGSGDLTSLLDDLAVCVARTDLDATVTHTGELALLAALVQPVEVAAYWQEPDDEDLALADRSVRDVLLPVAQAVTAAPAAQWWSTPMARDRQQYVEWLGGRDLRAGSVGRSGWP
jgi:hypothetical protein